MSGDTLKRYIQELKPDCEIVGIFGNVADVACFYIENEIPYAVTFNKKKHRISLNSKILIEFRLIVITEPEYHERIISRLNTVEFRDEWLGK